MEPLQPGALLGLRQPFPPVLLLSSSTSSPSESSSYEKSNLAGKESWKSRRQNNANVLVQGMRLWFLPGVAEVQLELIPKFEEGRFGMDIKRTEQGFICINSVAEGLAADRAGLRDLHEEARMGDHLLLIPRLEGKSVIPSNASSARQIHCCDHNKIRKKKLVWTVNRMEKVEIHIMASPNQASKEMDRRSCGLRTAALVQQCSKDKFKAHMYQRKMANPKYIFKFSRIFRCK